MALDDKVNPSLQAADLIASVVNDTFLGWLKQGKPLHVSVATKWYNHFELIGTWDEAHMLRSLIRTIASRRFAKGLLPSPPQRGTTKGERKRMRRELVKRKITDGAKACYR